MRYSHVSHWSSSKTFSSPVSHSQNLTQTTSHIPRKCILFPPLLSLVVHLEVLYSVPLSQLCGLILKSRDKLSKVMIANQR